MGNSSRPETGCVHLLSHNGPLTAFFPLLKAPLTGVDEESVCKNHLILGQHLYDDLQGRDFHLYGGGKLRVKANKSCGSFHHDFFPGDNLVSYNKKQLRHYTVS